MTTQSPALRRLIANPFGAAQDPSKQVPAGGQAPQPVLQRPPRALEPASSPQNPAAAAISQPTRALGDMQWRPTLNSGVDRTGAPVYDNASVQRLLERRPGLQRPARPDFSNVIKGASTVATRQLEPTTEATPAVSGNGAAVPRPAVSTVLRVGSSGVSAGPATAPEPAMARPLETDYTRPAPPDPAPQPVIPRPGTTPEVQMATQRALDGQRGQARAVRADAAEILNPMSHSAELMRRLENSQRSYFHKGSPQARRLVGEAFAAQLGAQSAASAQGQRAAGETAERGVGHQAEAMEGAARRQLDADRFNVDAGYRERALASDTETRRMEIARPTLQTADDGGLLSVTGSSATPVTGPDGQPVRTLQPAQRDYAAERDDNLLAELIGLQKDQFGEYPADALEMARQQLDTIRTGQRGDSGQAAPAASAAPKVGDTIDGYRFRGGDPSNPANWEAR